MRFLIDASLPRGVAGVILRHGHEVLDVRDLEMRAAPDVLIAKYAREHGLCLVTGDFDFADVRNYPPERYRGIVVIEPAGDVSASAICRIMDSVLSRPEIVERMSGHLAIATNHQVRLRPA